MWTQKFKDIWFIFICLSAINFFNPLNIISPETYKLIFYISVFIPFIFLLLDSKERYIPYPVFYIFLIFFGIFSGFICSVFIHEQSFSNSLIASLPYIFCFLCFFVFTWLNPSEFLLLKTLWIISLFSILVYIVNYFLFPTIIFGSTNIDSINTSRGMLRLPFFNLIIIVFFIFYFINKGLYIKSKKPFYISFILFLCVIFSLTRQYILWTSILCGLLIFNKISFLKKILLISTLFFVYFCILPNITIYNSLIQTSKKEASEGIDNYIRVKAADYYINDAQDGFITKIFGNGVPALHKSKWGKKLDEETNWSISHTGYYLVDVGWIGYYYYFGIFGIVGLVGLLIKSSLFRYANNFQYPSYWFWFIILISFTSGPVIYYGQLLYIVLIIFYIYRYSLDNKFLI